MIEAYAHPPVALGPFQQDTDAGIALLREKLNHRQARRMSAQSILITSLLPELGIRPEDAVLYGSTYADSPSLEKFLASYPAASPLQFQNSIHAGAFIQACIYRALPISLLLPFAGREHLVFEVLFSALTQAGSDRVCVFSEIEATWMTDRGVASDTSYAWGFRLSTQPVAGSFRIRFTAHPEPQTEALDVSPRDLLSALQQGRSSVLSHPSYGTIHIDVP